MSSVARHPRPPELVGMPLEEIAARYVARFRDRKADWAAFEDAKIEGFKRAQHRFIGAGGSGKHGDAAVIPPRSQPHGPPPVSAGTAFAFTVDCVAGDTVAPEASGAGPRET